MEDAGLPEGKFGIGSIKNQHCHTVSSNPDHRWICIKCKLGAAKDRPHLVINVSLYISVILTDNKNDHECSVCNTLKILEPGLCLESLKNHVRISKYITYLPLHSIQIR